MPRIGEPAPDFELLNQDNKAIKLADYRGSHHRMIHFLEGVPSRDYAHSSDLR